MRRILATIFLLGLGFGAKPISARLLPTHPVAHDFNADATGHPLQFAVLLHTNNSAVLGQKVFNVGVDFFGLGLIALIVNGLVMNFRYWGRSPGRKEAAYKLYNRGLAFAVIIVGVGAGLMILGTRLSHQGS